MVGPVPEGWLVAVCRLVRQGGWVTERALIEAAWGAVTSTQAKGDAAGAAKAVAGAVGVGLLQTAGPLALLARQRDVVEAEVAVETLIAALSHRNWPGDAELIAQLTAAASGAGTGRQAIAVDLDQLADILGDQRGGYLDLSTGMTWPAELVEDGQVEDVDPEEDPERWLGVLGEGSRDGWRDMADFTDELTDPGVREDLRATLDGKGAFRRFQRALDRHDTYRVHWRVFSTERRTGRARVWLTDEGYEPVL